MSSSYLANVPKLKGRENYDDWAFALENLLILEGADKYLKQETPVVEAAASGMVATTDAKTRAKVILTIDSSLYVHIKNAKTTKELWTTLKCLFDDSGFSRRITLLRHLISIRLENCENMTNYVTQIVETSQRLSGTGFNINDEWVGSLMLAGLPERFMPMIMAIEHSGISITADSIKTKLLDMESVQVSEMECNSALVAKGWNKKDKNGNTTKQRPQTSHSHLSNSNGKTITCYKCKETGHYRNQCPLLHEKPEKKKQTNVFSVVFLSGNFTKQDFYIDSGASMHLIANENWLKNRQYSPKLPNIVVANETKVPVLCSGDVEIVTSRDYAVTVKNVLCVPSLATNLLSVSELIRNGNSVNFKPNKCLIQNKSGDLVAEADLIDGVYKLNLKSIGFSENVKGYRIYDPVKNIVTTSRDVVKLEQKKKQDTVTISIENTDSVGELLEESVVKTESPEQLSGSESESEYLDVEDQKQESVDASNRVEAVAQPEILMEEKQKRQRKKPERYGYANICTNYIGDDEMTYAEAISGPEKQQWLQAMAEELQSFADNDVWEVVDTPDNASVVQCKWVLKKKLDCDNKVRYRARLVAKGFTQKAGIDYQETFSPVIRHSTLRLLFALSVQLDMDITHLDVTTAFLNGNLKESIFMHLPEGFPVADVKSSKVLKLKKAVYGLKQSSLAWYERVEETLCNLGFSKCKLEPCVFLKNHKNGKKTIVGLYVDDFLIFSDCKTDWLINALNQKFKMKNLGPVKKYLGMRVKKNCNEIRIDQENYIEQLLKRFDMDNCNTSETPIECKLNIEKSEVCDEKLPYQKLIGSLMYLAVMTRPDIAYSVSYLSQFNNSYSHIHWNYAKRVLKYLSRTKDFCLKYSKGKADIIGFVDADWASDTIDRRSYTGFCFIKSGSAISWESKKQRTVALSSCEAEYMALSEAGREAVYLQNLELEIIGSCNKIVLYSDSQSALKLALNHLSHKRSKHIDVRYNFIREIINNDVIETKYLPTSSMPADLLTKGLCGMKHYKFMKTLGVVQK